MNPPDVCCADLFTWFAIQRRDVLGGNRLKFTKSACVTVNVQPSFGVYDGALCCGLSSMANHRPHFLFTLILSLLLGGGGWGFCQIGVSGQSRCGGSHHRVFLLEGCTDAALPGFSIQ